MGKVHRLRKPPKRREQSRKRQPLDYVHAMLITLGVSVGVLAGLMAFNRESAFGAIVGGKPFECLSTEVLDGDTFDCDGTRIRLQGIDAPELPGHCRKGRDCAPGDPYASTTNLERLIDGSSVTCRKTDTDHYGRTVARCSAGVVDLSCSQVEGGFAVRRYAFILC